MQRWRIKWVGISGGFGYLTPDGELTDKKGNGADVFTSAEAAACLLRDYVCGPEWIDELTAFIAVERFDG